MGDIFNFLKDTVDDSVVIQFLRGKVAKGGNAIAERSGSIIKEEQRPLKEPTIYDWKLIMYIGIIILIVIMGFFFYIMPIVARRFPDTFFTLTGFGIPSWVWPPKTAFKPGIRSAILISTSIPL